MMGSMSVHPSRRHVLQAAALGAVGAPLLAACGNGANPAPTGGEVIATLDDLPDGGVKVVMTNAGSPVVLFRDGEAVTALSGVCTHQGCSVRNEVKHLLCPCHNSKFDFEGTPIDGPATEPLPAIAVTLVDGEVTVA